MSKIDFTKLNSANVGVENSVDTERVYDIKAYANLNGGKLVSVDGGTVTKDDVRVATFTKYGNNFSPSFFGVTDMTDMCAILSAISAFISDIETELESNPISI